MLKTVEDFLQRPRNLGTAPNRLDPAVGGPLALPHEQSQLLFAGLANQIERVLKAKLWNNIDIARIFLIK